MKSILKEIPVNDPFLKKLKKKNDNLIEIYQEYEQLFEPRIQNGNEVTVFNKVNMTVSKTEIDQRLSKTINELYQLINNNNDTILYLESTPRSGQGRKKYNIDTTEYIIPSKYL